MQNEVQSRAVLPVWEYTTPNTLHWSYTASIKAAWLSTYQHTSSERESTDSYRGSWQQVKRPVCASLSQDTFAISKPYITCCCLTISCFGRWIKSLGISSGKNSPYCWNSRNNVNCLLMIYKIWLICHY